MNSSASPGTVSKRPAFQSAFACSIRLGREETKFHQMWRGPSMVSPPTNAIRVDLFSALRTVIASAVEPKAGRMGND
jgi:hypothetical protein